MRLRVAPLPASSRSARVSFRGCPLLRSLSAEPASDSSGCPSSSALRLCRRSLFELPRTSDAFGASGFLRGSGFPQWLPHSSCCASDTGLRLPLAPHLRLYRRWIFESPRFSHLSAVPAVKAPSCPGLRTSGIADDQYPGRPEHYPPAPADGMSELPRITHHPVRLR